MLYPQGKMSSPPGYIGLYLCLSKDEENHVFDTEFRFKLINFKNLKKSICAGKIIKKTLLTERNC